MTLERPAVVLLGASNLTRGFAAALDATRRRLGGPVDVYAALGAGRSYGTRSRVLFRDLPGIAECGLWEALAARPKGPARALICDVGNDLLYQAPLDDLERWLRFCLDRLSGLGAQVTMLQLPLMNVRRVTRAQFELVKQMFASSFDGDLPGLVAKAEAMAVTMTDLAEEYGAALVEQRAEWYGFDPIHYRQKMWRAAWDEILAGWDAGRPHGPRRAGLAEMVYLWTRVPERRWLFGREQRGRQPSGTLADGSTVSVY